MIAAYIYVRTFDAFDLDAVERFEAEMTDRTVTTWACVALPRTP